MFGERLDLDRGCLSHNYGTTHIILFFLIHYTIFIHITAIIINNNNNSIDNRPSPCAIALRTTTSISATSEKVLGRERYSINSLVKNIYENKIILLLAMQRDECTHPENPNWGSGTARVRAEARTMIVFIFSSVNSLFLRRRRSKLAVACCDGTRSQAS